MRQAGIIAAAGLEAVVNNYVRLSEVLFLFQAAFLCFVFLSPVLSAAPCLYLCTRGSMYLAVRLALERGL